MRFFIYYLVVINSISFVTMWYDKKQAKKHGWRVPEARIFMLAALLGGPGVLFGMFIFRHKTKHLKFLFGIPCIIFLQAIIVLRILGIL